MNLPVFVSPCFIWMIDGAEQNEEVLKSMEKKNAPLIKRIYIIRQLMNKAFNLEIKMKYCLASEKKHNIYIFT